MGELAEEDIAAQKIVQTTVEGKAGAGRKSGMYYVSAIVAIGSLAVCFFMAIWVAASGQDVYEARLELFKKAIIYATLVYFISGIIWISLKELSEKQRS